MTTTRKVFLILGTVCVIATLSGIIVLTGMEYQARAALPLEEQTAEAIYRNYDGAVCLACDFGRIFFAMFGSLAFVAVLLGWGIYEVGSRILVKIATPK